jgi:hypothetical protein
VYVTSVLPHIIWTTMNFVYNTHSFTVRIALSRLEIASTDCLVVQLHFGAHCDAVG